MSTGEKKSSQPESKPLANIQKRLTEQELREFKEIFDLVDKDGGGTISRDELKKLMETLGVKALEEQLDQMMSEVDVDGSGDIDFKGIRKQRFSSFQNLCK
jgi:Ca2+-binding EF-hand superfamily protein